MAGDYITRSEPRFETEWETVEMEYDGARSTYAAVLGPRPHRTLVRYREYVATDRSAFGDPPYVHTDLDRVPIYFILGRERDIEELYYRRLRRRRFRTAGSIRRRTLWGSARTGPASECRFGLTGNYRGQG